MTVKEYCDMMLELRTDIRTKYALILSVKEAAESITSSYATVMVQSNGSIRPAADKVDQYVDIESLLAVELLLRNEMIYVIGKVLMFLDDPRCVEVLQKLYIEGRSVSETMDDLELTRVTIFRRKKRGLELLRIAAADLDYALAKKENMYADYENLPDFYCFRLVPLQGTNKYDVDIITK